jgi:DNA modification methylase
MDNQPQLLNFESEEQFFEGEKEKKEGYLKYLTEKLSDPEFLKIEGFPNGDDDAILALSDPPYFTACPNPLIKDIVHEWESGKEQVSQYKRYPFSSDVSESKAGTIYNSHIYHTKVPHKAVMRYILHYTNPGDIVFDGFCGTGMTGVAAQLCGNVNEINNLGYVVKDKNVIFEDKIISSVGLRKSVLIDLSPVATFISHNQNSSNNRIIFEKEANRIFKELIDEIGWMYKTWHPNVLSKDKVECLIDYTIWSDVLICPNCSEDLLYWEIAVDKTTGYKKDKNSEITCTHCGLDLAKHNIQKKYITQYDHVLDRNIETVKRIPVLIEYKFKGIKLRKPLDYHDLEILERIDKTAIDHWFPTNKIPKGDKTGELIRLGCSNVHHLYTRRNLISWAYLIFKINESKNQVKNRLRFWAQSVALGHTILNRYLAASFSQVNRLLKGTLYVAPFLSEVSPWYSLNGKIQAHIKALMTEDGNSIISTQSATDIPQLQSNSIDYIYIDPPFGKNIMYSELNFIWESWLGVITNNNNEAVISKTQNKELFEYQQLMEDCFHEFFRILKPGHWMTVEFHNSSNAVWNSITEGILKSGFIIADVSTLDKQQMTMNQMNYAGSVKQDLIISTYKPSNEFTEKFKRFGGKAEGVWEFVRNHLSNIRIVEVNNGKLLINPERMDYLLFDRMVAYHIQAGLSIPLSAGNFYQGLRERFPERDRMFFIPEQTPEYDKERLNVTEVIQYSLFVVDEKSSIQWLRNLLDSNSGGMKLTYQEIQPKFLQQLQQVRHEKLPELMHILEQNFLQDNQGRWYVPDPNKASDLEKIRNKALLREFNQYLEGTKKIKQFRTEAIRAGFADAWQKKDSQNNS